MKALSLSRTKLILLLVFLTTTIILSGVFGSLSVIRYCKKQKEAANKATLKYEALNKEVKDIRQIYSDFRAIIADDLGIEMKKSGKEVGKGGPETPVSSFMPPDEEKRAYAIDQDLPSVLMEARTLQSDLKDLSAIARQNVKKLAMTPSIWPVIIEPGGKRPWISSGFGMRHSPFTGAWVMHEGIDIPDHRGTPLIATADGVVERVGRDRYLGKFVQIRHNDVFTTRYGHMDRIADGIRKGKKVKRRDIIGYMGRTGRATGYHVHYEVWVRGKRVNPINYILN